MYLSIMLRILILTGYLAACAGASTAARVEVITAEGLKLAATLDGMDVERFWQPGEAIHWRSGSAQ
jgi:hypothetical protein